MGKCLICGNECNDKNKCCSVKCDAQYRHIQQYKYFLEHPEEFARGNYTPKHFYEEFSKEFDGLNIKNFQKKKKKL